MPEIRIPKIFKCSDIYKILLSAHSCGYNRKEKLEKLRRKNRGNTLLGQSIDELVDNLENRDCSNQKQLKKIRPDADLVHNDGFYIFNVHVH